MSECGVLPHLRPEVVAEEPVTNYETRRLAFGDTLRQLRKAAGLSGRQVADQAGWVPSKVSRMENAKQAITDEDVVTYCRITNTPESVVNELRQELREMRLQEASWDRQLRTGHRALQEYSQELEGSASCIRLFEVSLVPGLVQTAEYARHVLIHAAELRQTPRDTDDAVRARMSRQQVIYDSSKEIEVLCSEAGLRHPIAPPSVMAAQLDRLLALADMSTMRLAILPIDTPLQAVPLHGFVILDNLVLVETINTEMSITEPPDLALYNRWFDTLWGRAVDGEQARGLLRRLLSFYSGQASKNES